MIITEHAARRFVQRLAPSMLLPAARAVLRRASASAVLLPSRTYKGQHMWATADSDALGAVLVCKHDPVVGLVIVTVLSTAEASELSDEGVNEVREAFERASAAKEEQQRIIEAERAAAGPRETRREMEDRYRFEAITAPQRRAQKDARRAEHKRLEKAARARKHAAREAKQKKEKEARTLEKAAANIKRAKEKRQHHAINMARWAGVIP